MPLDPCYLDLLSTLAPQVDWDETKKERFSALYDRLLLTNEKMNVTAVTGKAGVVLKHFADSLSLLQFPSFASAAEGGALCDLGCGGGFPGIPLAVALPGAAITMIDSTEKKIRSVRENAALLGLSGICAVCGRGEELARDGAPLRERFDVVVSRAVAPLPVLTELCLPFVKPGGMFIAMKGAKSEEETTASRRGAGQLGSEKPVIIPVRFPEADLSILPPEEREEAESYLSAERSLIVFRKTRSTPSVFPRSWAAMKKKPL